MFDPEKPTRTTWSWYDENGWLPDNGHEIGLEDIETVLASEYDQLLALYSARYLENIRLLNDASLWRNRAITAEDELRGVGRIGHRPRNYKGNWR